MAGQKKDDSKLFWKVNLKEFTKYWYDETPGKKKDASGGPELSELKQLNVLAYILQNVHQSDNTVIFTYDKIAKKTGVSKDTVARIIGRLGEKDCIRKVHNGVYMINPCVMVWGTESKRSKLNSQFKEAKKIRKFHKSGKATQGESKQDQAESMSRDAGPMSQEAELMSQEAELMQEEDMPEEIILEQPAGLWDM